MASSKSATNFLPYSARIPCVLILSSPKFKIFASELPTSDFTILSRPNRGCHWRAPTLRESLTIPLNALRTTSACSGVSASDFRTAAAP